MKVLIKIRTKNKQQFLLKIESEGEAFLSAEIQHFSSSEYTQENLSSLYY